MSATQGRLIEDFMPEADVAERHEILVHAAPDIVFDVAYNFDLQSIRIVRAIFWLRAAILGGEKPSRDMFSHGLVAETSAMGWGRLAERPGRELVMGAVTQPWQPTVTFRRLAPTQFATFTDAEFVKIVWTLEVEPLGPKLTRFRTETRACATDERARKKFRRYWWLASIGIVLIRRLLLPAVRRKAERLGRRNTPVVTSPVAEPSSIIKE